jgi:hypothetical protein
VRLLVLRQGVWLDDERGVVVALPGCVHGRLAARRAHRLCKGILIDYAQARSSTRFGPLLLALLGVSRRVAIPLQVVLAAHGVRV